MVNQDLSDLLEDNRFKEVKLLKKKNLPHKLHWFIEEDYFSEELLEIHNYELDRFVNLSKEGYKLFVEATHQIINRNQLHLLGIPDSFHNCIYHSWQQRDKHPFLYGRFDINGGFDRTNPKIIEFNADTCSTLPETLFWQPLQLEQLGSGYRQFNNFTTEIEKVFTALKGHIPFENPSFLASTLGYNEDVLNANCITDSAYKSGFYPFYLDLEKVVFSAEEGIFYEIDGEYQPVDVFFKIFPWDWIIHEEPELAKTLSSIITKDLSIVLNPAYTTIWQNKRFLSYITHNFPNDFIAKTYDSQPSNSNYVVKPIYGRLGENIVINTSKVVASKGDYGNQQKIYQEFCPLAKDKENYFYQTGMILVGDTPSALNVRAQDSEIITDDCEFMSHFLR